MREFKDSSFWAYVRKSVENYSNWLKNIEIENQRLMESGKGGIDAFMEYEDTDRESILSMLRGAVKFGACTGEEYRQSLAIMLVVDKEYRHELMRIELMAAGEI